MVVLTSTSQLTASWHHSHKISSTHLQGYPLCMNLTQMTIIPTTAGRNPSEAAARGSIGAPRGSVCSSTNSLWSVLFLPHPPYYPAVPFLRFLQMTLENKCRSRGGPWCGAPSELRDPDKEAVTRAAHWANRAAEVRKGPRKEHLVWGPKEGSPPPSSWLRFWSVTRSCC